MTTGLSREERTEWFATVSGRVNKDRSAREVATWLGPGEAGRIVGVTGQYITSLCRNGELEAVPTSLGWLVRPESVEGFRQKRIEKVRAKLKALETK